MYLFCFFGAVKDQQKGFGETLTVAEMQQHLSSASPEKMSFTFRKEKKRNCFFRNFATFRPVENDQMFSPKPPFSLQVASAVPQPAAPPGLSSPSPAGWTEESTSAVPSSPSRWPADQQPFSLHLRAGREAADAYFLTHRLLAYSSQNSCRQEEGEDDKKEDEELR